MDRYCDLHTHSCFSDGTCSPAEIIEKAVSLELSAVALTDHNTVAGIPDFLQAAEGKPLLAVPGVEISTEYGETELHILGLFLPPDSFDSITALLDGFNQKKEASNRHLVASLKNAGYRLDYDSIRKSHPQGTVNRATIAAALVQKGYVASVSEAFQGLLSKKAGFYVPPPRLSAFEAIAFLRSLHALPVLAHPFLNLKTEEILRQFLAEALPYGLAAMETMYPAFSPEATAKLQAIAREFRLLESGGSDFHGDTKPHIALGTGKGTLAVPAAFVNQLKNLLQDRDTPPPDSCIH